MENNLSQNVRRANSVLLSEPRDYTNDSLFNKSQLKQLIPQKVASFMRKRTSALNPNKEYRMYSDQLEDIYIEELKERDSNALLVEEILTAKNSSNPYRESLYDMLYSKQDPLFNNNQVHKFRG